MSIKTGQKIEPGEEKKDGGLTEEEESGEGAGERGIEEAADGEIKAGIPLGIEVIARRNRAVLLFFRHDGLVTIRPSFELRRSAFYYSFRPLSSPRSLLCPSSSLAGRGNRALRRFRKKSGVSFSTR